MSPDLGIRHAVRRYGDDWRLATFARATLRGTDVTGHPDRALIEIERTPASVSRTRDVHGTGCALRVKPAGLALGFYLVDLEQETP